MRKQGQSLLDYLWENFGWTTTNNSGDPSKRILTQEQALELFGKGGGSLDLSNLTLKLIEIIRDAVKGDYDMSNDFNNDFSI